MIRRSVPFLQISLDDWPEVLKQAGSTSDSRELVFLIENSDRLEPKQHKQLIRQAINLAQINSDYKLLIAILKQLNNHAPLRALALASIFEFANERDHQFIELINVLTDGEKALILGAFIEATRLDPNADRRLLRLKALLSAIPTKIRAFYWHEAQNLAEFGNDDTKLLLIGLVAKFQKEDRMIIFDKLINITNKIKEPFKHAMAFAVINDLGGQISELQLKQAKNAANTIPDESLKEMVLARLDELA